MARSARFATVLVAALLPAVAGGAEPPQPDPPGAVAPGLPEPAPPPVWIRGPFSVQGPVPPEGPQGGCLPCRPAGPRRRAVHGRRRLHQAADRRQLRVLCAGRCSGRGPSGHVLVPPRPRAGRRVLPAWRPARHPDPVHAHGQRDGLLEPRPLARGHLREPGPPFADADGETRPACANGLSVEGQHKRTRYGTPARFP